MSESKLMSVMCSRFRLVSPLRVRRLRREVRERKPLLLRLSLIGRSPCTISLLEPLSIRILFPSSGSHLHTRVCPSLPCMHGHLLCSTPPLIPRNLFHTVARHATSKSRYSTTSQVETSTNEVQAHACVGRGVLLLALSARAGS